MTTPTFNTRHTVTGVLQRLTESQIRPFKDYLEIVPDDAKPLEPGLFRPGTVGEFKNPEPPTDAVAAAQAAYDSVIAEGNHPNSTVAREAKAALVNAQAEADAEAEAAALATEQIQDGERVTAIKSETEGDPQ